jgi:hypothetical protein
VTWASVTPATATITVGGLATGVGVGTSTIRATSGAISGSTVLTVTSGSPANLVVTEVITRTGGNVIVNLKITNIGGTAASNVVLSSVKVAADIGTPLPQSIGTIAAGSFAGATITVPESVGAPGAASSLTLNGTYTGGTFTSSARIVLPLEETVVQ